MDTPFFGLNKDGTRISVEQVFFQQLAEANEREIIALKGSIDSLKEANESLKDSNENRGKIIKYLQDSLERKNKELDALHFVWCSGGCEGGTHRWSEGQLTEEIVREAELSVQRMRSWLNNFEYRKRANG